MQTINDRKCLASWAVFKQLCDEGHKNIYEVLRDFIKATIYRNSLRSFTAASLTQQVNKDYGFNLKLAVVDFAIKEMPLEINSKTGFYDCNPADYSEEADFDKKIDESIAINNIILNELYSYAEKEKSETLNDSEKESLVNSLIYYLLNNSYEDSNSTIISAFILLCRKDDHLSVALTNILEGVVRYVGVSYDTPENASSRWTNEMTIYLDTEILFHMAGFNGTLYKQLFDDFFELVEEINKDSLEKRHRILISLKYFDYVTEEIDRFFEKAGEIINGKLALNPSVTAMKEITLGCKTDSELAEKKGLFLAMINNHGIEPDNNETSFYDVSQYAFNLEDDSIVEKYCKDNSYKRKKYVRSSLLSLSHVNVLRQGVSNKSFEKLGFVLLTDNYITQKVARMDDVKKDGDKPLCTNLYYVTNRMWFRLRKAFGNNATPKVFDVISKAQIILSTKINDSVYSQYEKLVERMDKKEIDGEDALEILYQLRNQVKNPEEIDTVEEIDEAIKSVGEPELQKYIEEAEYRKTKQQETEEENQRLNRLNEQMTARNEAVQRENKTVLQENEDIRRENEIIRQENERVKAESTKKAEQLEETSRLNAELNETLLKTRKDRYESEMKLYNRNMSDYVGQRRKQTTRAFLMFVIFLVITILLAYFVNEMEQLNGIPSVVKTIATIVLCQIIPVWRVWATKISLKDAWKVIFKKDDSSFIVEYKKNNPEPTLLQ